MLRALVRAVLIAYKYVISTKESTEKQLLRLMNDDINKPSISIGSITSKSGDVIFGDQTKTISHAPLDAPASPESAAEEKPSKNPPASEIAAPELGKALDVFLSFAHEDENAARRLAQHLSMAGLSVFWDRQLRPGQTWDEVLEREIDRARWVVVLWSSSSVASDFVRSEASRAKALDKLLPVLIGEATIPLEFSRMHAVGLDQAVELLLEAIKAD